MRPSNNKLALIVEDEVIVAIFLQNVLCEVGITAEIVTTAQNALSLVGRQAFDLAFVDLGLPDASGLEVIDMLRRDNPQMLIVLSTAYCNRTRNDSILDEPNIQLLPKPYTQDEVTEVLTKYGYHVGPGRI